MSSEVWEHLAEHAECEIGGGGEVMIYAGQLALHAVRFEYQPVHDQMAWIVTKDDEQYLLDVETIYAVRTIVEGVEG